MSDMDKAQRLMNAASARRRAAHSAPESTRETLFADAVTDLDEAIWLCRQAREQDRLAEALHLRANLARDAGDDTLAATLWREAISLLRLGQDKLALAHKLKHLADLRASQDERDSAEDGFSEAMRLYRAHPDAKPLDIANTAASYAHFLEQIKERSRSLELWREAQAHYAAIDLAEGVHVCEVRIDHLLGT